MFEACRVGFRWFRCNRVIPHKTPCAVLLKILCSVFTVVLFVFHNGTTINENRKSQGFDCFLSGNMLFDRLFPSRMLYPFWCTPRNVVVADTFFRYPFNFASETIQIRTRMSVPYIPTRLTWRPSDGPSQGVISSRPNATVAQHVFRQIRTLYIRYARSIQSGRSIIDSTTLTGNVARVSARNRSPSTEFRPSYSRHSVSYRSEF